MSATNHAKEIQQDTRNYIVTALLQLLQTTSLHEIKVTTLVKRAGVSRMAFYRNFDSIKEVLLSYYEPQVTALFDDVLRQVSPEEKLAKLSEFFESFAETLLLATKRDFEFVLQEVFNKNMNRFYLDNLSWQDLPETTVRYWTKFMASGVYTIWREWLVNGRKESLEDIHYIIGTFQTSTMNALLLTFKTNN